MKHPEYKDYSQVPRPVSDSTTASARRRRRRPGQRVAFPLALHRLMDRAEVARHDHICSWQPHGRAFKIHDKAAFEVNLLPQHFANQGQFASFQRQLNLYGFLRLNRVNTDQGAYYHAYFLRGRSDLAALIRRTRVRGNRVRQSLDVASEPELSLFPILPPVILLDQPEEEASATSPAAEEEQGLEDHEDEEKENESQEDDEGGEIAGERRVRRRSSASLTIPPGPEPPEMASEDHRPTTARAAKSLRRTLETQLPAASSSAARSNPGDMPGSPRNSSSLPTGQRRRRSSPGPIFELKPPPPVPPLCPPPEEPQCRPSESSSGEASWKNSSHQQLLSTDPSNLNWLASAYNATAATSTTTIASTTSPSPLLEMMQLLAQNPSLWPHYQQPLQQLQEPMNAASLLFPSFSSSSSFTSHAAATAAATILIQQRQEAHVRSLTPSASARLPPISQHHPSQHLNSRQVPYCGAHESAATGMEQSTLLPGGGSASEPSVFSSLDALIHGNLSVDPSFTQQQQQLHGQDSQHQVQQSLIVSMPSWESDPRGLLSAAATAAPSYDVTLEDILREERKILEQVSLQHHIGDQEGQGGLSVLSETAVLEEASLASFMGGSSEGDFKYHIPSASSFRTGGTPTSDLGVMSSEDNVQNTSSGGESEAEQSSRPGRKRSLPAAFHATGTTSRERLPSQVKEHNFQEEETGAAVLSDSLESKVESESSRSQKRPRRIESEALPSPLIINSALAQSLRSQSPSSSPDLRVSMQEASDMIDFLRDVDLESSRSLGFTSISSDPSSSRGSSGQRQKLASRSSTSVSVGVDTSFSTERLTPASASLSSSEPNEQRNVLWDKSSSGKVHATGSAGSHPQTIMGLAMQTAGLIGKESHIPTESSDMATTRGSSTNESRDCSSEENFRRFRASSLGSCMSSSEDNRQGTLRPEREVHGNETDTTAREEQAVRPRATRQSDSSDKSSRTDHFDLEMSPASQSRRSSNEAIPPRVASDTTDILEYANLEASQPESSHQGTSRACYPTLFNSDCVARSDESIMSDKDSPFLLSSQLSSTLHLSIGSNAVSLREATDMLDFLRDVDLESLRSGGSGVASKSSAHLPNRQAQLMPEQSPEQNAPTSSEGESESEQGPTKAGVAASKARASSPPSDIGGFSSDGNVPSSSLSRPSGQGSTDENVPSSSSGGESDGDKNKTEKRSPRGNKTRFADEQVERPNRHSPGDGVSDNGISEENAPIPSENESEAEQGPTKTRAVTSVVRTAGPPSDIGGDSSDGNVPSSSLSRPSGHGSTDENAPFSSSGGESDGDKGQRAKSRATATICRRPRAHPSDEGTGSSDGDEARSEPNTLGDGASDNGSSEENVPNSSEGESEGERGPTTKMGAGAGQVRTGSPPSDVGGGSSDGNAPSSSLSRPSGQGSTDANAPSSSSSSGGESDGDQGQRTRMIAIGTRRTGRFGDGKSASSGYQAEKTDRHRSGDEVSNNGSSGENAPTTSSEGESEGESWQLKPGAVASGVRTSSDLGDGSSDGNVPSYSRSRPSGHRSTDENAPSSSSRGESDGDDKVQRVKLHLTTAMGPRKKADSGDEGSGSSDGDLARPERKSRAVRGHPGSSEENAPSTDENAPYSSSGGESDGY